MEAGRVQRVAAGLALIGLVMLGASDPAAAQEPGAEVDWSTGLIIAHGAAVGDVRAPTRALARIKAERKAMQRAVEKLSKALATLPIAGGMTLLKTPGGKDYSGRIAADCLRLDADFGSDGSVVVRAALPLDSVRAALFGADAPQQDKGLPSVIVLGAERVKPALGIQLAFEKLSYRGPVVFVKGKEAAEKIAGPGALEVTAKSSANGVIQLSRATELERISKSRSLVVIVRGKP